MKHQDHHGHILEQARDALLTNAVVVLQRAMKKFLRRRKRHKQTSAAVLIQKTWRGYQEKRAYQKVGDKNDLTLREKKNRFKKVWFILEFYL